MPNIFEILETCIEISSDHLSCPYSQFDPKIRPGALISHHRDEMAYDTAANVPWKYFLTKIFRPQYLVHIVHDIPYSYLQ